MIRWFASRRLVSALLLAFVCSWSVPVAAQDDDTDDPLPSIAEKTDGLERTDGFVPFYWDARQGKLWLELDRFDEDLLYVTSLPAGLGSNDIGLDRGQLGARRVVRFERVGPTVLMVQPNLDYRATTRNPRERRAVRDAFASGVVFGFEVAAEDADGTVLVDATDFVVRDAHGIVRTLKDEEQGAFELDNSRSAPYLPALKGFPQNTELEARLTVTTDEEPGDFVQDTAADPFAVTLRVRHSLIELPDTSGYTVRHHDPRSGALYTDFRDYAVPIGEDIPQRLVNRHRLTCAGPRDAEGLCPVEEPIVYYLDPGTPEPVRSALLDGGRWWAEAFEAAGFRDAYRVEMLPEDADAQDVRYNTIQWVHRRTRGWSYGASVTDPRTGEILKGHVTLGSLRVRQDYLLAEGLLAPYDGAAADGFAPDDDPMLEMALARIRQLSAHEIGHTIGLAHNFAASTTNRASVMDYPAPLATVDGNSISLENAYDTGIGEWDKVAINFAYREIDAGQDEDAVLEGILNDAAADGLRFISDRDARPAGAAHPYAHLWDNGEDAVAALDREMDVRRVAMQRFDDRVIRTGEPLAMLEEGLVPLYLRHRYQVQGTVKLLGGVHYTYALRGDDTATMPEPVGSDDQMAALNGLLATLSPDVLRVPDVAREMLPPRPPGHPRTRELFPGHTGLTFDAYAPAEVAATMVLDLLVHPQRAMRLVAQHDANADLPSLRAVLDRVTDAVWEADVPGSAYDAELQRTVQQVWTDVLIDRAAHNDVAMAVRSRTTAHLRDLSDWLAENPGRDAETQAHRALMQDRIERFLNRDQESSTPPPVLETPPGSPIGSGTAPTWQQRHTQRVAWLHRWAPAPRCSHLH